MKQQLKLIYLKFKLKGKVLNSKLPRFLRITKIGLITTAIAFMLSVGVVYAQETGSSSDEGRANLDVFSEAQLGYTVKNLAEALGPTSIDPDTGEKKVGATGVIQGFIGKTYEGSNELSAVGYLTDTVEDAKLVKPVQAQALGVTVLRPVLELWKVVRNISLTFIIAIGLIISIMILFRVQQGQGYVTLVNALPKLIVTVVLIIFSYAFAGLLYDISTVGSKAIVSIFYEQFVNDAIVNEPYQYPATILDQNGKITGNPLTGGSGVADYNIFRLMSNLVNWRTWIVYDCNDPPDQWEDFGPSHPLYGKCPGEIQDLIASPTNSWVIDNIVKGALGMLTDELVKLILNVFILMIYFKVFFALIGAFAQILLRTVFAPIQFLVLPIKGFGVVTDWARSLLAQVLVFPATILLILIAALMAGITQAPFYILSGKGIGEFTTAPYLISHSVNEENNLIIIGKIVAVIIVAMIPNVPKIIEQALQVQGAQYGEQAAAQLKSAASKIPVVGGIANMF